MSDGGRRGHRLLGRAAIGVLLAAATLVNHLAWLGWHRERDVGPDGGVSGPYEAWQIAGLVIVLAILAAFAGWRGHPVIGTLVIGGVMWASWTLDAATSDDSGPWAVGALLLFPAAFCGVGLVAWLAASLRRRSTGR
ncbi:hypothetical protein AB0B89_28100 [Sphaerisporangium sp. NPDC049002]|uniref:hypothetical protein n=1 Tax=unclassified Sphaerisporangium TaxID=2630420 RepID=UPI0033C71D87